VIGDRVTLEVVIEQTTDALPVDLLRLADPDEENIKEYLFEGKLFRAKLGDETIGALVLLKTRPRTMEIMNISVYEQYQNKGVGRKLIMQAIEYARESNIKTLEIGTGNPGLVQMMLYQKCGFRITGIEFDFFRRYLKERVYENGIECRDMIRMTMEL